MKDNRGHVYARLSELKAGDRVQVDDGFTCMKPWSMHDLRANENGELYIPCRSGGHYLDGQVVDDYVVGVYL